MMSKQSAKKYGVILSLSSLLGACRGTPETGVKATDAGELSDKDPATNAPGDDDVTAGGESGGQDAASGGTGGTDPPPVGTMAGNTQGGVSNTPDEPVADSGSPSEKGGASNEETGGTPNAGSTGCGVAPDTLTPGYQTVELNGVSRQFVVDLPKDYDPNRAYPLLFAFHGAGDTGEKFKSWAGVADAVEGIYIYPDGVNGIWGDEVYNNDFSLEYAAYEHVTQNYCVDADRVFAFGFSWGGWATTQFACNAADVLRGVISIAGGGPNGGCELSRIPLMLIHGMADNAEPISSSQSTRSRYVKVNECSDDTSAFAPEPCVQHAGCSAPIVWCAHEGAHGIPPFTGAAIGAFISSL